MTLTELNTAVQQYLETEETSFVANLPIFIRNAEQRIYNAVNLPATRKTFTGALTIGVGTIDLAALSPAFLAPISLALSVNGNPQFLINKELSYLTEMYPSSTTGVPTLYAQVDETALIVRPLPVAAYTYTLNYYAKADSILTDGTSWLGDNFDSVLMYATLVEGAMYLKLDAAAVQLYETGFQAKMELLKMLIDGKNQTDQYRTGSQRA
jgi:hypothetical protein